MTIFSWPDTFATIRNGTDLKPSNQFNSTYTAAGSKSLRLTNIIYNRGKCPISNCGNYMRDWQHLFDNICLKISIYDVLLIMFFWWQTLVDVSLVTCTCQWFLNDICSIMLSWTEIIAKVTHHIPLEMVLNALIILLHLIESTNGSPTLSKQWP